MPVEWVQHANISVPPMQRHHNMLNVTLAIRTTYAQPAGRGIYNISITCGKYKYYI